MGIIDDSKSYTTKALAELLGYRQCRSVDKLLRDISCPVFSSGNRKIVSGKQFRLALEKSSECSNTSRHGS
jgi:hypothetical protein